MSLIKTLNAIYNANKSFTKPFHDEVKRNLKDFEAERSYVKGKKKGVYNRHVATSRYDLTIPYIFATHESMTASFFENLPDILIAGRTTNTDKVEMLKALYEYFKDKANLDEFLGMSAWWFFLVGMCNADVEFKSEIEDYQPQLDSNGIPMLDENGELVMIPVYSYNDPVATVDSPLKIFFSPDSEFTIDGKKIPNYIKERLVNVDEIKDIYDKEVEADTEIEVDGVDTKDETSNYLKRAKVKYFYGKLPSTVKDELEGNEEFGVKWSYNQNYKIYFTKDEILLIEEIGAKPCKLARFYTNLSKFFGFGLGKTLQPFQEDMSIRRNQQIAYADRFAFPWLAVNGETTVGQKELMDYQKRTPLTWNGDKPPQYIEPPQMPSIIQQADDASRSDAQFVSGTLDLSKGAQQTNTVKTATGQQLFAQSQDKRLQKARTNIAKYYRAVLIEMFKQARDNWNDEEKHVTYTSDDGMDKDITITAQDLQGIDFDTDIDFNLDSVSVNQDIVSQRWISLLETITANQIPSADVDKVYQKALKESFKIQNPEYYVKDMEGIDPTTGQPIQPMPQQPPQQQGVENPETVPQPQTMGNQLAPTPPMSPNGI